MVVLLLLSNIGLRLFPDLLANFVIYRGSLSKQDRKEYINAVRCMQTRPSRLDPAQFPGARNRYDDFVGVHIVQSLTIHRTVRLHFRSVFIVTVPDDLFSYILL